MVKYMIFQKGSDTLYYLMHGLGLIFACIYLITLYVTIGIALL